MPNPVPVGPSLDRYAEERGLTRRQGNGDDTLVVCYSHRDRTRFAAGINNINEGAAGLMVSINISAKPNECNYASLYKAINYVENYFDSIVEYSNHVIEGEKYAPGDHIPTRYLVNEQNFTIKYMRKLALVVNSLMHLTKNGSRKMALARFLPLLPPLARIRWAECKSLKKRDAEYKATDVRTIQNGVRYLLMKTAFHKIKLKKVRPRNKGGQ